MKDSSFQSHGSLPSIYPDQKKSKHPIWWHARAIKNIRPGNHNPKIQEADNIIQILGQFQLPWNTNQWISILVQWWKNQTQYSAKDYLIQILLSNQSIQLNTMISNSTHYKPQMMRKAKPKHNTTILSYMAGSIYTREYIQMYLSIYI